MTVDANSLSDRLYADALGASLRMPSAFVQARTKVTWDDIEPYVRQRASIHRKDLSATAAEAERALEDTQAKWREMTYGDLAAREIDLLARAARKLLQADGREMILRVDHENPGREILRWRFVSLALPPGILLAVATESGFASPTAVRILNRSISPDRPVAQNHLHHAAMTTFEDLWAALRLYALTRVGDFTRSLQRLRAFCPGLHPGVCLARESGTKLLRIKDQLARGKHMADWADLIRQAFIARRVLDLHSSHVVPLAACTDSICEEGRATLRAFIAGRARSHSGSGTSYPWPEELVLLARRYRDANAPNILRLSPGVRKNLIREQAAAERNILVRAFEHLGADAIPDPKYETLFLQYLRIKTAVFGLLVHHPGQGGLKQFLEHFNQIKVYAPESDVLKPPRPDEPGLDVRATEYRVAPDAWLTTLSRDDEIEESVPEMSVGPEAAWIVHFKRLEEDKSKKLPLYLAAIQRMEGEATKIGDALEREPAQLRKLRGIDICGVEGWQPLWVSTQTLRDLRSRSRRTAAKRPGLRLEPLRLTVHTGEDFRWLTSGMRAVAEPFHWNLIERGDRIGHAIAITLSPKDWWKRHSGEVIPVKRFDRLLDLAFLAEYTEGGNDPRTPEQSEWLRLEIAGLVKILWSERNDRTTTDFIKVASELWRHLGRRLTRRLMGMSRWSGDELHEEWLYRYLWNRGTQARAHEDIRMKVDDDRKRAHERDLLIKARARLIHQVARWQVCIESNPSSNLIVGSLDAVASQDFLQRRPTRESKFGDETLTWTISTDDPITFSTCLADEYAYAWAGMVLRQNKPYDPSYTRALLDEAAETSMRMRFTVPDHDGDRAGRGKDLDRGRAHRD